MAESPGPATTGRSLVQQSTEQDANSSCPSPSHPLPLKRKKKEPGAPTLKNVVVLRSSDVRKREGRLLMPYTTEMSAIKKSPKPRFKKLEISSSMTQCDIQAKLEEIFPYLQQQRFHFAKAVEGGSRLELYGEPSIWDGHLIKQRLTGNSVLYILTDEENDDEQDPTVSNLSTNTCSLHNPMATTGSSRERDQVPRGVDSRDLPGHASSVVKPIQCSSSWGTVTEVVPSCSSSQQSPAVNVEVNRAGTRECTNNATEGDQENEETLESNNESQLSDWPSDSGIEATDNPFVDERGNGNSNSLDLGVTINPPAVPLQGGQVCWFDFTPMLPLWFNSGTATFGDLGTVELSRHNNSLIGRPIPARPEAGSENVILRSEYGVYLGQTKIEYYDEIERSIEFLVRDKKHHPRLLRALASVSESSVGDGQISGSCGSTQPLKTLKLSVYAAAKFGAKQFLKTVFNSKAGRKVFNAYKDNPPLPEVIARKYGHEETASYLDEITIRFSREANIFPEEPQEIDWQELIALSEETKENQELCISCDDENHRAECDVIIDTGYLGDTETSSSTMSSPSRSDSEIDDTGFCFKAPKEIKARGERAQLAYQRALRDGAVNVQRARILLIGQDRAGKTSLKKSLIGLPFDPKENSTEGIEVDPSVFQLDVHEVKNWQPIDKSERGLLGCSEDVAKSVVEKLSIVSRYPWFREEEKGTEKHDSDQLANENYKSGTTVDDTDGEKRDDSFLNQVYDQKMDSVSEPPSSEPEHELMIDTTLPSDEIEKHAEKWIKYVKGKKAVTEKSVSRIELWDFAGQQLYYTFHPVFLTSRAICILVCNLNKSLHEVAQPCVRQGNHNFTLDNPNGETNLDNLLSWLSTVHGITQMRGETCDDAEGKLPPLRPPVIIVGTHADKPFEDITTMKLKIQKEIAGKDYEGHVVQPIFSIDNTSKLIQRRLKKVFRKDTNIDGIQELRDKIMEVLSKEPYMKESIPVRWLNFEKVVITLLSKKVYHLNLRKLQTYVRDNCFINDEEEFTTMVDFYHDLGIIIKHCSTVILSAEWLIDLFKQLIPIPQFDETEPRVSKLWQEVKESGVLRLELLHHVFSKFLLKGAAKDDILDLMQQFGLIAKFSPSKTDVKYLVPCQLRMPPDSICSMVPSSSDPCPLYVYFLTGFVPHGLFTRLVSRLVRWCSEAGPAQSPTLYQNGACFVIGRKVIHDLVLICKKQFIKFFVKQKTQGQKISVEETSEVAVLVRKFVEATLQTLSHDLLYLRGVQYEIRVACSYCQLAECSGHNQMGCTHDGCLHLLELRQGDPLICKRKPSERLLTDRGKEERFSQVPSEEAYTPSPDTAQSHPGRSILKVALLANEWGSSKGGLSAMNRTLAIHLAKQATVEVTILVPEFECGEEDKRTARSYNIAIKEVQRRPTFSDPFDWLSFPLKDLDIQVVIGHGAKLGRQAQIIRKSHRCKWMQVVHTEPEELAMHKNYANAIAKGEGKNRAEVELCQIADLYMAVGPKLKDALSSKLRSSHRDVFQLIPGSFAEFSGAKHGKQERANFKVLTFGRGDFEDLCLKGYDIAAKAIVELQDSSYRLLFVGAPYGKQDEVAEILLQTGISKNQLTVRSFVQNKERLKELFCEVDVAIMPSREGFGLTALEAMSAGLPILVSGNSGFGETLRGLTQGKSFVIDSDDPKEWAKAIDAIRQKPRIQRLEEIRRLREVYEEKFSWKRQCQLLVEKMWKMVYGDLRTFHTLHTLQQIQLDAHRETSQTELSLNLKRIAQEKGFVISCNQGEGNCMFFALSEQLDVAKGMRISHEEIRQTVVCFLRDSPTLPDGTELFQFVSGYSSWDDYLTSMMTDGTWGDHVILHGVANCFETCIHVISSLPHHNDVIICPEYDDNVNNRLMLGHVHELNFVSLLPV